MADHDCLLLHQASSTHDLAARRFAPEDPVEQILQHLALKANERLVCIGSDEVTARVTHRAASIYPKGQVSMGSLAPPDPQGHPPSPFDAAWASLVSLGDLPALKSTVRPGAHVVGECYGQICARGPLQRLLTSADGVDPALVLALRSRGVVRPPPDASLSMLAFSPRLIQAGFDIVSLAIAPRTEALPRGLDHFLDTNFASSLSAVDARQIKQDVEDWLAPNFRDSQGNWSLVRLDFQFHVVRTA